MPIEMSQRKLIAPLIVSIFLHLGVLKALEFLPKNFLAYTPHKIAKPNKPIEVRSISRKDLKKYRTVGVKNGKKNFSMPVKNKKVAAKPSPQPKAINIQTSSKKVVTKAKPIKTKPAKKEISLNALRVKPKTKVGPPLNQKMKTLEKDSSETSKLKVTTKNPVNYQRTREIQTDVIKQLAVSPDNATVLRKTGFNMQLEPPEGVSEDELNTMEKIYYSFQKRTFRSYVGSFLRNYRDTLTNHPAVKQSLQTEPHRLAARVIFDSNGNIVSIRILRSSHSDDIHNMFEETLKDIRKLPNPPKDLLTKNGQFTIYYQLKIN